MYALDTLFNLATTLAIDKLQVHNPRTHALGQDAVVTVYIPRA